MDVLLGKKVVLSAYIPGESGYYPIACLQEVSLNVTTELIPTTTSDSGTYRTFMPRLSEWKLSVSGVWFLRDQSAVKYMPLQLIANQVRRDGLDIKLLMTDEGDYVRSIEGHVYPPESVFTGTAGSLAKFTSEFQGSGTLTLDNAVTINPGQVTPIEYTATGTEGTTIQNNDWILKEVLWLDREDSNCQITTDGFILPEGRLVYYNASAGSFTFPTALGAGEFIKGLIQ